MNLFYSPYSIYISLGMVYAGARGTTAKEMAEVLHFTLPQNRLYAAFRALTGELVTRGGEGFQLHTVCSLWGQLDHTFLPRFLSILGDDYGAQLRKVDFRGQPEVARRTINQWVTEETKGKIKGLVPPGGITTLTRLVLGNAVYFNAQWLHPFDRARTSDGIFYLLDNQTVSVPMMKTDARLGYAAGNGWEAVELPYEGSETAMVLLLPERGRFREVESIFSAEWVGKVVAELQSKSVCLAVPKFAYKASLKLKSVLSELGMGLPFQPAKADFSGMDGKRDLFLDEVYHKAFITVDETGTEAAAASAVVVAAKIAPLSSSCIELKVDRPFVFFIWDVKRKVVLFLGRVLDPR